MKGRQGSHVQVVRARAVLLAVVRRVRQPVAVHHFQNVELGRRAACASAFPPAFTAALRVWFAAGRAA